MLHELMRAFRSANQLTLEMPGAAHEGNLREQAMLVYLTALALATLRGHSVVASVLGQFGMREKDTSGMWTGCSEVPRVLS